MTAHVARLLAACKTDRISDLSPSAVQAALDGLRKPKDEEDDGLSLQTRNHYIRHVKQFSRWLHRDGRAREDALLPLTMFNVNVDRRLERRALTDEEISRLLDATLNGPVDKEGRRAGRPVSLLGMLPPDRAMLYRLALGTGFRKSELRSLKPESFSLQGDPPTVTVTAAYSKRRREDVQPIRRDLADVLRPFLTGREPGRPVFNLPDKTAPMIKADLNAARIPYARGGHVADFHSLRHTFITRLVRSGANVKVVPDLARHSTPTLTLGRYAHVEVMGPEEGAGRVAPGGSRRHRARSAAGNGDGRHTLRRRDGGGDSSTLSSHPSRRGTTCHQGGIEGRWREEAKGPRKRGPNGQTAQFVTT